ncbi:MAG: IS4 family transposase [Nitrospirae bacterium CG11_big_fil_rev_8_21_14_0_20_41_14]|nr:MAG: IS4 family transposase [Nitrospirae bacterium CG11_big_fil_rev_8_21_14_0_20_41_14]
MSHLNTIYNQLLHLIPRHQFESLVQRYNGDYYVKYFTCWQQLITLLYAQIKYKDSLRDIETSLKAQSNRWYHIGLEDIKRSTLSDANNQRDYRIYEDFFYTLLDRCKGITPKHKFRFKNPLYTLDATVIDLCLSLFPWARFRKRKGALKLHYLYDHSGSIPTFLVVTDAKQHEIKVAKELDLPISPDSIISVDRAYIDYKWLYSLKKSRVSFVTRAKKNLKYEVIGQHEVNEKKGLLFDKTIRLTGYYQSRYYPEPLRLIGFIDPETKKELIFLTNNFMLSAYTITQVYKARWQIELFFKWIKQNLKIKSFLGTSRNAVLTQIWVAMCYYLLLTYIKYQTKYSYSLLELSWIFSEMIFERVSLIDLLSCRHYNISKVREPDLQQSLF